MGELRSLGEIAPFLNGLLAAGGFAASSCVGDTLSAHSGELRTHGVVIDNSYIWPNEPAACRLTNTVAFCST